MLRANSYDYSKYINEWQSYFFKIYLLSISRITYYSIMNCVKYGATSIGAILNNSVVFRGMYAVATILSIYSKKTLQYLLMSVLKM